MNKNMKRKKKKYTFTLSPEIVERFLDKYHWKYFLSKSEFVNKVLFYLETHPNLRKDIYGSETTDSLETIQSEQEEEIFKL